MRKSALVIGVLAIALFAILHSYKPKPKGTVYQDIPYIVPTP